MHISRSDKTHFSPLLSVGDIERLLATQTQSFPAVQLTHSAAPVDISEYTDDSRRVLAKQLIARYGKGATIVISQAHEQFSALATYKRDIQTALQLRCQTNVYLSPPDQQGFNPHYDSHDVFIIQVEGSKVFNIYEGGVELPYSHEPFEAGVHECGALSESILLEAGDTLYIPRGVMHDAVARDTTSLHITLGVYAITMQDVMLEMIHRLGEQDVRYRRSIPNSSLLSEAKSAAADTSVMNVCLKPELSETAFREAITTLLDDVAIDTTQDLSGSLLQPPSTQLMNDQSEIRLRVDRVMCIDQASSGFRCRAQGQVLVFSNVFYQAMSQLMNGSWVALGQLNVSPDGDRTAFCKELLNAHLLDLR